MRIAAIHAKRNEAVVEVVNLLASKRYVELELLSSRTGMTAEQIEHAIREYGRTVVPMPSSSVGLIDYVPVLDSKPVEWSVYVPVFTQEEGRSDLTIDLSLIESNTGSLVVEINGIHVL